MRFVFPTMAYEAEAKDYIREHRDYQSEINGSSGLHHYLDRNTYVEWVELVISQTDIANVPEGDVPRFTYFYVEDESNRIIGMINIRLALNDFFRRESGHIGYGIRPTERGKGYATRMLQETLAFCKPIGLQEVIVTCDKSNPASAAVITKNGGVLEEEFYSAHFGEVLQRYRIENR